MVITKVQYLNGLEQLELEKSKAVEMHNEKIRALKYLWNKIKPASVKTIRQSVQQKVKTPQTNGSLMQKGIRTEAIREAIKAMGNLPFTSNDIKAWIKKNKPGIASILHPSYASVFLCSQKAKTVKVLQLGHAGNSSLYQKL